MKLETLINATVASVALFGLGYALYQLLSALLRFNLLTIETVLNRTIGG